MQIGKFSRNINVKSASSAESTRRKKQNLIDFAFQYFSIKTYLEILPALVKSS